MVTTLILEMSAGLVTLRSCFLKKHLQKNPGIRKRDQMMAFLSLLIQKPRVYTGFPKGARCAFVKSLLQDCFSLFWENHKAFGFSKTTYDKLPNAQISINTFLKMKWLLLAVGIQSGKYRDNYQNTMVYFFVNDMMSR